MLKKEIRILGLSGTTIGDRTIVVSVVFRGSLWLDGVATSVMEARESNYNLKVSNLIKATKQFSQLHAIMISRRLTTKREISVHDLARKMKLPVIAITKSYRGTRIRKREVYDFNIEVSGKHVAVSAAGVDRDEAERLYGIGCSPGSRIPEAVRIADLLAEELNRTLTNRGSQRGTK